jgi:hypothetical protein
MGVEKASIERAFKFCMEAPPAVINHAIELLSRSGEGSFTVSDGRTKLWLSKRAKDELNRLIREEKL